MNICVIGLHWGDEGKGKIIDLLSPWFDYIVRFQGGANAGHTVVVENEEFVFHLIPSGILREEKINVIGNGVAFDPQTFLEELDFLHSKGIPTQGRLFVDERCHVVMPYHKKLDQLREKGKGKIGTTCRGIGPCYEDKHSRTGIRVLDLLNKEILKEKIERSLKEKNIVFEHLYKEPPMSAEEIAEKYSTLAEKIAPYVADTVHMLLKAEREGKSIMFEGAQGTLLDIDHGTYPYVTSSHAFAGGISPGCGFPPTMLGKVIAVTKAYTTRVGAGPMPTELKDEIGEFLRKKGKEYGATTGRPRRCGWFDAVAGRYAARVNGVHFITLTKLDVLDELDEIKVAVAYKCGGKIIEEFPASTEVLQHCVPVYETLKGWKQKTSNAKSFEELPKQAKDYINFLAKALEAPVGIVSVGAERDSTFFVRPVEEILG